MFLGTNTREMMRVTRISKVVVLVVHVWWTWGFMNCVYNVFHFKKRTCEIVGAPGVLGPREYWGVEWIILIDLTLNLYLVFERNHVEVIKKFLWGFCYWVWAIITHEATCWFLKKKSIWDIDPLWFIELK